MPRLPTTTRFVANLLLVVLLVSAQTAALAHAYEHDLGSPQNKACTACVTAGQLASACVDHAAATELEAFNSPLNCHVKSAHQTIAHIVVRQRGPPCSV